MRVLVVEDEYITRNFLSSIIDWKEHDLNLIGLAKDGIEALNIIEKEKVDVVITDLKMPKMDGNTLIKRLKEKNFIGKIIVLSNYDDFSLVKDAMKNGAFEYLLKITINQDELLNILKKAREELMQSNKLIKDSNIIEISSEKIKVNEYLEKYLKGEIDLNIDKVLEKKYLTNYNFIYLRVLSTDVETLEQENKLNSFMSNVINSCALHVNSKLLSLIHIRRNEFGIVIKTESNINDITLLINNITRNVKQYLNISFEKILQQECSEIKECLQLIERERNELHYKINSRVINCRIEIKKVIEYINNNLGKKLALESLAKIVNMNESYLSRIFKDELGMTISDYIKKTRLEKAKELLKENDMRVKDVAITIGIQDQLYFSRLFTKFFNMTPSEYREKYNKV
ncbi:helix-turn-helix domain-containing protein [Romboutsia weinsteinii]|uniref:Stage 0 sporulation protein A homolog n=1 Tax=Romboutsia weinsteinii TaxID=2020949 RepID=A0A371IZY5_9FIRM|nr:helix-turn-helix domain-containing protein [Romboutsia weinsteinii]RDY26035.1 helix-turn-helix domain-containing protein [Romboutsia weinsteinii]